MSDEFKTDTAAAEGCAPSAGSLNWWVSGWRRFMNVAPEPRSTTFAFDRLRIARRRMVKTSSENDQDQRPKSAVEKL